MKKLVTLMMVFVMMFSFSITASAEKSREGEVTTEYNANASYRLGNFYRVDGGKFVNSAGEQIILSGVEFDANGMVVAPDGRLIDPQHVRLNADGTLTGPYGVLLGYYEYVSAPSGVSPKTGETHVMLYGLGIAMAVFASGAVVVRKKAMTA